MLLQFHKKIKYKISMKPGAETKNCHLNFLLISFLSYLASFHSLVHVKLLEYPIIACRNSKKNLQIVKRAGVPVF